MKFLHAADVHLDSPLRGLRNKSGAPVDSIRNASRRALENLIALALKESVDFVVIAGDLFDGDRDNYDTSLFFVRQAVRLRDAKIPLLLISGNHDAQSKMMRNLTWPENVTMFGTKAAETITAESLGLSSPLAVHGWSFATASEDRNLAASYPRRIKGLFNLGMLHTSLTGAEGHDSYAPCTLSDLSAREYDYWALGHIHQRNWLPRPLAQGAAPVIFPGNLQGRHIKESGPKGCYFIEADDQGVTKREFVPLDVLRWELVEVDASSCNNMDDFYEQCVSKLHLAQQGAADRPLALRLQCIGQGASFDRLAAQPKKVEAEITNLIVQQFDDLIWLERLRFESVVNRSSSPGALSDAVSEYLRSEMDLLASSPENSQYRLSVGDLLKKLPNELVDEFGIELDSFTQSAWWREMATEASTLIWSRLRQSGADQGASR